MLAIFQKACAHPPEELKCPDSYRSTRKPKLPRDILQGLLSTHPENAFSIAFGSSAALAYIPRLTDYPYCPRLFCGHDDVYCLFLGSLHNLCSLNREYGLTKVTNEAVVVIEAYKTLRDRGPYPVDQVVKEFEGSFAFVLYDGKTSSVFAALGSDGGVKLYWGLAADGSLAFSDDLELIKDGCGKSFAPFPTGCLFHSERGLMSFEHPMNIMKAMPRIDSEGVLCGSNFTVDAYSRVGNIPRRGSEANWVLGGEQSL